MKISLIKIVLLLLSVTSLLKAQSYKYDNKWDEVPEIISKIIQPSFPDKDFDITSFGAAGDGKTDCTESFKKAIEKCNSSGGGRVVIPEGTFITGAIHLLSNVNLHLTKNAVIKFSENSSKYLPVVFTRWEGVECMNYSPLIYAFEQDNIAVTGEGILDGQGSNENWWSWKGNKDDGWREGMPSQKEAREKLFEMGEKNTPPEERIFGENSYLRPNFFQPYRCKNVLVEGVTFKNSPMWFIHPVLCENVSVIGVSIEGLGPNNDGCNPESSINVLIKDCYFNTGDDCIAIKSGRNNDGRRINIPSKNIIIQNSVMKEGHGGVVIGSEISGGVSNVFAENCRMSSPDLDRAIRIKTNSVRGGLIENIFVRDIEVGEVSEAVLKIDYYYEEGDAGEFTPTVRNLSLENVNSSKSQYGIWIKAYDYSPVTNLKIRNCNFNDVEKGNLLENVQKPCIRSLIVNGEEYITD